MTDALLQGLQRALGALGDRAWLATLSLLWLAVMFIPLERAWPCRPGQRVWRAGAWTDLAFFVGQHVVFAGLVAAWIVWLGAQLGRLEPVGALRALTGSWPLWAKAGLALILGDLVAYWGHRLQHRVDGLWRFHAVHHSSPEVDWLAAHREHPLDGLYTQTLINLPLLLLGLELGAALGLVSARALWAILIHANVSLPLGPLREVLGGPELHRWHHARGRDVGNYANLAPWLDRLFGTYHRPGPPPQALGLDSPMPETYLGLLWPPHPRTQRACAPSEAPGESPDESSPDTGPEHARRDGAGDAADQDAAARLDA